jgi:hypothetical protein
METKTPVKPEQSFAQESPWSAQDKMLRLLWEFCWFVFCVWTPKPFNPWRLFWLDVFGATIEGKPFVHQRARIAIPWHLTLHDRACLGDRANAYSLGEIEIGEPLFRKQRLQSQELQHGSRRKRRPLRIVAETIVLNGALLHRAVKIADRFACQK